MNPWPLELSAVVALVLFSLRLASWLSWHLRTRKVRRRRARVKGYLPIYDEQWEPRR